MFFIRNQKLFFLALLLSVVLLSTALPVYAQFGSQQPGGFGSQQPDCTGLCNPLKFGTLPQFLSEVLKVVAEIALPIVVLFLVYVGFLFVTAQGNEEKLKEAKKYLLWTIIGALIVLGASVLSQAIQTTVSNL